jgi:hypothetical protein
MIGTVANYWLINLIRFVMQSYTHLWKSFANRFYLVLHASRFPGWKKLYPETKHDLYLFFLNNVTTQYDIKKDINWLTLCNPAKKGDQVERVIYQVTFCNESFNGLLVEFIYVSLSRTVSVSYNVCRIADKEVK